MKRRNIEVRILESAARFTRIDAVTIAHKLHANDDEIGQAIRALREDGYLKEVPAQDGRKYRITLDGINFVNCRRLDSRNLWISIIALAFSAIALIKDIV